jgi:hypothetical protein
MSSAPTRKDELVPAVEDAAALIRAALRATAAATAVGLPYGRIRPGQCRYFLAGEPGPRATCCGRPVTGAGRLGSSYCAEHRGRLVVPVAAGRARSRA